MVVFEEYDTSDDSDCSIYGVNWFAQTFTVGAADHTVEKVKLKMSRFGSSPGTLTVSIRATDGSGHPTSTDLTSGTIDANTFTNDSAGAWYTITLTEYTLSATTKYAIVCRALDGDAVNSVRWRIDATSPTYTGGNRENSTDSGSSWSSSSGVDCMFEVWGRNSSTFYINTLTVSPSNLNRQGTNATTLTTTFHDEDDLAANQYTASFSVREPDNSTEHGPYSGTVAKDGTKEYSATYSLDPDSSFSLGKYDLKVVVTVA